MDKWSRMLRILNMLDRKEVCSEQKMIDLFGVTRRTVFRDLGALKEAGFPIEYDRSKGTYIFNLEHPKRFITCRREDPSFRTSFSKLPCLWE